MSLRRKTLLFVAGSLALLVGAMLTAVYAIVGRGFARIEEQQMRDKVTGVRSILATMLREHVERFGDWAEWDDSAIFLQDSNQTWYDSNITADSIASLGVDALIYERFDGARPLAVALDEESWSLVGIPSDLESHLTASSLLRGVEANAEPFGGILMLADGPWLFASRPILKTDRSPPPMPGRLIAGVRVDTQWVERLRQFTFLDIELLPLRELARDSELGSAYAALAAGAPTLVRNRSNEVQEGFALVDDLYGTPSLLLDVDRPRTMRVHTDSVVRSAVFALFLCGVGVALLALVGLRRSVVEPLDRLLGGVRECEAGRRASVQIRKADEIGALGAAFNRMAETIAQREAALVDAHAELARLFDNLRQGVLAFGPDGRVTGETSRRAPEIFRNPSLVGASIVELLYGDREDWDVERQAFADWPAAVFAHPASAWSELVAAAPTEVVLRAGTPDERHVALEFRPIVAEGRIERVMLLATDETDKHRILQESLSKDARHARQIEAMQRRFASGSHLFARFLRETQDRLDALERTLRTDSTEAFRLAHTVKGEARLFELRELEAAANALEEGLAGRNEIDGMLDALAATRAELRSARESFVAASPIGPAVLDQVPVQHQDLERLAEAVVEICDRADASAIERLRRISDRLAARPFGELVAPLCEQAPIWAARIDKRAAVAVAGRDVAVPPALAAALSGAMTHLLRNSVAHGLETEAARETRGKEPLGSISLTARESDRGPIVEISDDGSGIDRARIRSRAAALGIPCGDELEVLFADGFSTRTSVDELSGRGVGLGAVREDLARIGYGVRLESEPGQGTRVTIAPLAPAASALQ